jgi:hypothetical protein
MRAISIAALSVCIAATFFPSIVLAQTNTQRQAPPALTQSRQAPPAVQFRTRSRSERAGIARSLGARVLDAQVGASFSMTPRQNFIPNRVIMYASHATLDSGFDATGSLEFRTMDDLALSRLGFRLSGMNNHRVIVDCAVAAFHTVQFRIGMHSGVTWSAQMPATDGHLTFLTPPIPNGAVLNIDTNMPSQMEGGTYWAHWTLTGCEFTPLPG